jgi:tRNASer (uridine44-2'-O)-methyltransferase
VIEEGNEEEIDEHARVDIKGKGKEIGLAGYEDWITRRRLRVRLVPKRTFDEAIEVNYYFMIKDDQALVLLVPELSETVDGPKAPYYHPQVFALAYRYFSTSTSTSASIQIDLIPLLPIAEFNISHRLYRTALSLLTFLERIAITEEVGYEKRMNFDLLVDKATVQNLYLVLKEKYKCVLFFS